MFSTQIPACRGVACAIGALAKAGKPNLSLRRQGSSLRSKFVLRSSYFVPHNPFLFSTCPRPRYNLPMQDWTIQKLLNWTADYFTEKGIDSPRLSAELLISHVLQTRRIELYTQFDKPVAKQQLDKLHDLVKRAAEYEPIAYLIGKTEFYSLELFITRDCLIPRPETELLVERAIKFLRSITPQQSVCDLCTGSGCIAVAIAKNVPEATITATDISDAALETAARNIEKHGLSSRVKLLCGDLFDPVMPELDTGKFDLIVCNPPYVSSSEFERLDRNVKDYEPKAALAGGVDGLDVYRRIVEKADKFLKPSGAIVLEIGYKQGQAVREILEQAGYLTDIAIEKDHHDNDRIATAKRKTNRE
jgi:release factor glutamine methyltransferase